ncbi:MAG: pilus assembly protein PilM [Solirubrobacteraceae bacterium]
MPQIRRAPKGRTVTGLDIEPGAVRAVRARTVAGRIVVDQAVSAPLEPGIVRDGEVVEPEALGAVLRDLFDEHKLDRRVRIGVANQRVVVRHLLLPPITDPKQLATAVRFMAADEMPMPIDQAVLDHVVLGPVETPEGPRTRVLVIAARRSMIDSLLAAAQIAGLRPEGIDLSAFAMVRALGATREGVTLHLSVGGVVTLAVTKGSECVFTRVVGGGLETMAAELAERHTIVVDEARSALRGVRLEAPVVVAPDDEPVAIDTSDPVAADALAVVTDGLRRIAGEVRSSIDFHLGVDHSGEAPTVERVLLTGSVLGIEGSVDELARRLSVPVEAGDVEGAHDEPGAYAVAAGLTVSELAA